MASHTDKPPPTGSTNAGLNHEAILAIIFGSIAVVAFIILVIALYYIRRTSRRQLEQAERELQKERERLKFEKERERRTLMKGNYESPRTKRTDMTDVFVISNEKLSDGEKPLGVNSQTSAQTDAGFDHGKQFYNNPCFTTNDEKNGNT